MSSDPVALLALQQAVVLSAEAEVELTARAGSRPLLSVLIAARKEAAEAIGALVYASPSDPETIRDLQSRARRFADMVRFTQQIIAKGVEADHLITEHEAMEMQQLVGLDDPDERRAYGITPGVIE
jgi:hypothetical protein